MFTACHVYSDSVALYSMFTACHMYSDSIVLYSVLGLSQLSG